MGCGCKDKRPPVILNPKQIVKQEDGQTETTSTTGTTNN
jgi:hypothetical protein